MEKYSTSININTYIQYQDSYTLECILRKLIRHQFDQATIGLILESQPCRKSALSCDNNELMAIRHAQEMSVQQGYLGIHSTTPSNNARSAYFSSPDKTVCREGTSCRWLGVRTHVWVFETKPKSSVSRGCPARRAPKYVRLCVKIYFSGWSYARCLFVVRVRHHRNLPKLRG